MELHQQALVVAFGRPRVGVFELADQMREGIFEGVFGVYRTQRTTITHDMLTPSTTAAFVNLG